MAGTLETTRMALEEGNVEVAPATHEIPSIGEQARTALREFLASHWFSPAEMTDAYAELDEILDVYGIRPRPCGC